MILLCFMGYGKAVGGRRVRAVLSMLGFDFVALNDVRFCPDLELSYLCIGIRYKLGEYIRATRRRLPGLIKFDGKMIPILLFLPPRSAFRWQNDSPEVRKGKMSEITLTTARY